MEGYLIAVRPETQRQENQIDQSSIDIEEHLDFDLRHHREARNHTSSSSLTIIPKQ
jgi:hypothetical protein